MPNVVYTISFVDIGFLQVDVGFVFAASRKKTPKTSSSKLYFSRSTT
jgi:hypothetical protein